MFIFNLFLDLIYTRIRENLYLCNRFRLSKMENFLGNEIEKVVQNGKLFKKLG